MITLSNFTNKANCARPIFKKILTEKEKIGSNVQLVTNTDIDIYGKLQVFAGVVTAVCISDDIYSNTISP